MTNEQIVNVTKKYSDFLTNMGVIESIRQNDVPDSLNHVKWMLEQIPMFIEENKIDKANRWLGFVQGVFWVRNFYNIGEMRDDNR
jgi:hypothetical protein